MKKIYLFIPVWILSTSLFAQTVADSLVRDSVPILLTDTTSYNTHPRMMMYSGNQSWYEDSSSVYLLFYDKTPDTASYSSIWYRDLKNMGQETVFLQSNDSVRFSNPQATNSGAIFYEEWHDTVIFIKGLLIDPLTINGLDTVTIATVPAPVKMVANSNNVLWLKDSVLYNLSFTINSGTIVPGSIDTISTKDVDVCVADYVDNPWTNGLSFAYLTYKNNKNYLYGNSYSPYLIDSGIISGIHYNYNPMYLYYKKNDTVFVYTQTMYYGSFNPIVLMGNDTITPELAVADEGIMGVKAYGTASRMAFVPDTLHNVFNYSAASTDYLYQAADTFVYPDPAQWDGLYAYPFPVTDTIRNIIMHRGFIFYMGYDAESWDLKIILEVGHDSICSLYLVRSSVSDIGGKNNLIRDNFDLQIYPNPATDNLTISITNKELCITSVSIYNVMGKQVLPSLQFVPTKIRKGGKANEALNQQIASPQVRNDEIRVSISILPTGIYFVKVGTNQGTVVKEFVKLNR